jgi:hypothetical protein
MRLAPEALRSLANGYFLAAPAFAVPRVYERSRGECIL